MAVLRAGEMPDEPRAPAGVMARLRERRIRGGLTGGAEIEQQRAERMIVRRGGKLDTPRFGKPTVAGNNVSDQLPDQIEHAHAIGVCKVLTPRHELHDTL